MSICSLLSSTMLIMRDGERKVLTAGNMFYNTLSARQALRRHRRWSRRRPSTLTLMSLTSLSRLLWRCRHPDIVSGTGLLPLPAPNLHYINMHRRCQVGRSTTMPNALRGMYLLTTALCDKWSRSIGILYNVWSAHYLCQPSSRSTYLNYACWIVHEEHIMHTYMKIESK